MGGYFFQEQCGLHRSRRDTDRHAAESLCSERRRRLPGWVAGQAHADQRPQHVLNNSTGKTRRGQARDRLPPFLFRALRDLYAFTSIKTPKLMKSLFRAPPIAAILWLLRFD